MHGHMNEKYIYIYIYIYICMYVMLCVCVCVCIIHKVYYMWRYQDMVFIFKLGNLEWLTCKANH